MLRNSSRPFHDYYYEDGLYVFNLFTDQSRSEGMSFVSNSFESEYSALYLLRVPKFSNFLALIIVLHTSVATLTFMVENKQPWTESRFFLIITKHKDQEYPCGTEGLAWLESPSRKEMSWLTAIFLLSSYVK